jgi:hypothetical protein
MGLQQGIILEKCVVLKLLECFTTPNSKVKILNLPPRKIECKFIPVKQKLVELQINTK